MATLLSLLTAVVATTALAAHLVLKQFYIILSFATDALAVAAQQLVGIARRRSRTQGWCAQRARCRWGRAIRSSWVA